MIRRYKRYTIKENTDNIGLNLSRDLLPQIESSLYDEYLEFLKQNNIKVIQAMVNTTEVKPSQGEFNVDKIHSLLQSKKKSPIFISKDNYILDGHHRWAAECRKVIPLKLNVYKIDMNILDLIKKTHEFNNTRSGVITRLVRESINN